jgi:plastocyanin
MMRAAALKCAIIVAALAMAGPACSKSSMSPSPTTSAATFTITSTGVSPKTASVPIGSAVTFVNNDGVQHEMASDPHPVHTDCPALNVGVLNPGQTRMSSGLTVARTCGFHDHLRDQDQSLRGTITVQ